MRPGSRGPGGHSGQRIRENEELRTQNCNQLDNVPQVLNSSSEFPVPTSKFLEMSTRLATIDDAAAIAQIYRPYVESTVISFEVAPPDVDEITRRMTSILARLPWLVCERDGSIVGYAYGSPHRERAAYQWSVDTTVYVRADSHRTGVGRELYGRLMPLL